MAGADLAGVFLVIREILVVQQPVLVADEPVRAHPRGIPLHLDLHVLRDGVERAAELVHEDLLCLGEVVEIRVVAVPLVGELLHLGRLQIALAHTQHGEEHAGAPLFLDELDHLRIARRPDVEVAIGGENHAVVAAADEVGDCFVVGTANPLASGGAPAGFQPLDRVEDLGLLVPRCGGQHEAGVTGIHDHRDAVLRTQLVHEEPQRRFHERQLVLVHHRAGDIEQEHKVGRGQVCDVHPTRLQPDTDQLMLRLPRRRCDLGMDRQWIVAVGLGVAVGEIVHELFNADCVAWRQLPVLQDVAPHVAVRGAIDVDRERGKRIRGDGDELILDDLVVLLAVAGLTRVAPGLRTVVGACDAIDDIECIGP